MYGGASLDEAGPRDFNYAVSACQVELRTLLRARKPYLHRLLYSFRYHSLAAGPGHPEEAEEGTLLRVFGNESALTLPSLEEFLGGEGVQHLAHSALADSHFAGEVLLAG